MIMRTNFCGEILLIRESRGSKMTRPLDQKFCKNARKTWPEKLGIVLPCICFSKLSSLRSFCIT